MDKIQNLLTTDELLKELEDTSSETFITRQKKHQKKKIQWYIFWGIVIIAVLHLLLFSFPTIFGVHNTVQFFGQARVIGIAFVPGDVPERNGQVMVIHKYDVDQIAVGDKVVVYGLLSTTYFWEVEISDINQTAQTFEASYDGIYSVVYDFEDIDGVFVREANGVGVILLVSTRWTGLLSTAAVYGSLILVYYMMFIRELKVIKREDKHGQAEAT